MPYSNGSVLRMIKCDWCTSKLREGTGHPHPFTTVSYNFCSKSCVEKMLTCDKKCNKK